jgi:hypothetical protein
MYALSTRTVVDWLGNVATIAMIVGLGMTHWSATNSYKSLYKRTWKDRHLIVLKLCARIFGFSIACATALYSIGVVAIDLFLLLQPRLLNQTIFTIVATAFVALVLFQFRRSCRVVYGVSEAAVGLLVAVNHVSRETTLNTSLYVAVLVGGVYLVVRGLDNMEVGINAESDPVVKMAKAFWRRWSVGT